MQINQDKPPAQPAQPVQPVQPELPEYLTVKECQTICRFKYADSIRRAIYSGELPATRLKNKTLLIKATEFWDWFHSWDVKVTPKAKLKLQK